MDKPSSPPAPKPPHPLTVVGSTRDLVGSTRSIVNRPLTQADLVAVSALHARVFGPGRFARTAYRIREGTPAISPYCTGAFAGPDLVASLRLTVVTIGGTGHHLLLGPLAVAPEYSGLGFGKTLVSQCLTAAHAAGVGLVVLVGDRAYYDRFGFVPVPFGQITFPGPVNPARILAREVTPGALAAAQGMVGAGLAS